MKNNMKIKVTSAVLAVILTASLGTAALASSEPSREIGQPQTQTEAALPAQNENGAPALPEGQIPSGEPGEMPEGQTPSGEPGEMPEGQTPSGEPGEMPEGQTPSGEPGEMPEGQMPSGEPGEMPEGQMPSGEPGMNGEPNQEQGTFDKMRDLIGRLIEQILRFFGIQSNAPVQESEAFVPGTAPAEQPSGAPSGEPAGQSASGEAASEPSASGEMGEASGEMGSASGEMGGSSEMSGSYSAANTVTADSTGATYSSSNGDENAVLVSGGSVTLTDATVNKTGSSSGESADFYGVNAGVLATGGATLTIENATVTTDGTHANGVFSYGSGTVVNISDSTITTTSNNSGGIMTTGGATLNAANLTVNTSGNSSAAIRTDRGGGTVTVSEGSYATSGVGSPAVYSTADITVSDATLSSTASEAVVIEGGNSVTLVNDTVSGNNAKLNGQSTVKTNVLIYQSMSGDAAEGSSEFTMTGGSMTAGTGAMFHVTNVTTTINLTGVSFTYASDSDVFLDASSDSWGTAGKNGGHVTLNLNDQDIVGIITTDSSSSVAVNLANGSTWKLTGDSYVTSLTGDTSGIDLNGYTLYVNGVAWNA